MSKAQRILLALALALLVGGEVFAAERQPLPSNRCFSLVPEAAHHHDVPCGVPSTGVNCRATAFGAEQGRDFTQTGDGGATPFCWPARSVALGDYLPFIATRSEYAERDQMPVFRNRSTVMYYGTLGSYEDLMIELIGERDMAKHGNEILIKASLFWEGQRYNTIRPIIETENIIGMEFLDCPYDVSVEAIEIGANISSRLDYRDYAAGRNKAVLAEEIVNHMLDKYFREPSGRKEIKLAPCSGEPSAEEETEELSEVSEEPLCTFQVRIGGGKIAGEDESGTCRWRKTGQEGRVSRVASL